MRFLPHLVVLAAAAAPALSLAQTAGDSGDWLVRLRASYLQSANKDSTGCAGRRLRLISTRPAPGTDRCVARCKPGLALIWNNPGRVAECDPAAFSRSPSMHSTIRILRSEHAALVTLFRSATEELARSRQQHGLPDFALLRAMLFYIAEFPERHHHPKESALLFPRLRARTPLARSLLDRLDEDHARGDMRIRELEHALVAFEMLGEGRRAAFERALGRYVDFHLAHMSLEELEIFPLATRMLQARDWQELDAEFEACRDPLTGAESDSECVVLFEQILQRLQKRPT